MNDDSVTQQSRLRLLILYILYRGGLLNGDIQKLHAHAQLKPHERDVIDSLDLLGARVTKPLKDTLPPPQRLFPAKAPTGPVNEEESNLSRYEPALRTVLEEQIQGTLDPDLFPPTIPNLEANGIGADVAAQQTSLRNANKPTWARTRPVAHDQRQRILVFMAGGATYAEARACHQVSLNASKEIFLMSSHMLTPKLFIHQLRGLAIEKRLLDIPAERAPPKAPAHLFEKKPVQPNAGLPQQQRPPQAAQSTAPPTGAMQGASLDSSRPKGSFDPAVSGTPASGMDNKLKKSKNGDKKKKDKDGEEKKKRHHFFGRDR